MTTAAAQAASTTSTAVGPAVIVVLIIIVAWRYANPTRKDAKGTMQGRLLAVVLALIVFWALLAARHPAAGLNAAGGAISGLATLFDAIAKIL